MKRAFLCYAEQDSEIALKLATQLRASGIDIYINYDRMMNNGGFTRRLENELLSRRVMILLQSPHALKSPLVQTEIEFAYNHDVLIIPVTLKALNVRDTGEFRFLLNLRPIDFTEGKRGQMRDLVAAIDARLMNTLPDPNTISSQNAANLGETDVLRGHSSWVLGVTFSADGALMATASNDNTLCVWDIRRGTPALLATSDAHKAAVYAAAFSPADALLASAGSDGSVRLWRLDELPDLYEFTRFTDHKKPVYAAAFSRDGHLLASASHDESVIVRDVSHLTRTARADGAIMLPHAGHVYNVTFSPDGHTLASASRDSAIRVWRILDNDVQSLARSKPEVFKGHTSWVNAVTFSPNGLMMASGSNDGTARLWDALNREQIGVLHVNPNDEAVVAVAFSPDGSVLATACKDNTVRLWDVDTLESLAVLRGHDKWVHALAFNPNGQSLVTASGDGTVRFWSVNIPAANGH